MHRDHMGRRWVSLQNIDRPGRPDRPGVMPGRWLAAAGAVIAVLGLAVPVSAAARAERSVPAAAARTAGGGLAAGQTRAALGGAWGRARQIPGTAGLNVGGGAEVRSVSCSSPGNCSAVGYYSDAGQQAFVVTQANGIWGTARQVPGMAGIKAAGAVAVSVSCASAGNCSAGGYYRDRAGNFRAFVVTQASGAWGKAEQVPGTGAGGGIGSVSCASAGNCTAGGNDHGQAIVVTQRHGIWGTATQVPGIVRLNAGGGAVVSSVSCARAGNCAAGGYYRDANGGAPAFVATKVNGVWGAAEEVPGTAGLNKDGYAKLTSLSCASAGNCTAGGFYDDDGDNIQAFVITQANGIWGTATQVPGTEHFDSYDTDIRSVSCATAGNCSAGGTYLDSGHDNRAWVVTQANGIWGTAELVAGTGYDAVTQSVSCGAPGNCSAGGYRPGPGFHEAFVVNEINGAWGTATQVPGTAKLNTGGNADLASISCTAASRCSAGGSYTDSTGHQVFVTTRR